MKISISFKNDEFSDSEQTVRLINKIFDNKKIKIKETPLRDGYHHIYISLTNRQENAILNAESTAREG